MNIAVIESSFQCTEILSYLLNHESVDKLAQSLGIDYERGQKMSAIMEIVIFMRKLWTLNQQPRYVNAIQQMQRKWRRAHLPHMGPYPNEPAVNDEDIFLMEPISKFADWEVFSFKDDRGQVFAFHAKELGKHVFQFKNVFNPLTREPIAVADLRRLKKWMSIFCKNVLIEDTCLTKSWATPLLAFTDVTSETERRFGIFTQPEWYTDLDMYDIMNIFQQFHIYAGRSAPWMDELVEELAFEELDTVASQMALAKEMYRLVLAEGVENHLFMICCLFGSLAKVSNAIHESLPAWLWDIVV